MLSSLLRRIRRCVPVGRVDKDYFSAQAAAYNSHRPGYPAALFEALCQSLPAGAIVWDCATGNGQAATSLAAYADRVLASDISAAQLSHARNRDNIAYVRARAEAMPLPARSVDLVTVAQALHWFDFDRFYAEVRRVVKPGGLIAAWTYSFLAVAPQLGPEIERVVRWFYHDIVGPYWPPERRFVDAQYRTVPFPFAPVDLGTFAISLGWDMAAIVGYLGSWSATARYRTATGKEPLDELVRRLGAAWGDPATVRELSWDLSIRCGRVGS